MNLVTSDPGVAREVRTRIFDAGFTKSHELSAPLEVNWTDHVAELMLRQF
ncbi:MAG: hypothetical protein ACYDC1_15085 [Limisphaerales bacterium]